MAIMEEDPRQERRIEMKPEYCSVDELPLVMSVPQLAKLLNVIKLKKSNQSGSCGKRQGPLFS